jgi:hypothetical protein
VIFPGGRQDPEILELERTTSPEWFAQEIGADFSAFVGKIFSEFQETTHVRHHEFNPRWRNYIFWDWGYVRPCAAIEVQIDPMDNVYIWREHYRSYLPIREHCKVLKAREQPTGYHIDLMFGDAADPEATDTAAVEMGIGCISDPKAKENWREGVDCVKMFLRSHPTGREIDEFGTPEIVPKLFVDPSCVNVIREFNGYRAEDNDRSNLRESSSTSAALKRDDHCMDAIRYGLVHIYKLGATYSLRDILVSTSSDAGQMARGLVDPSGDTFFRDQVTLTSSMEF